MRRPLVTVLVLIVALVGITGMVLYKLKYDQMRMIVDGAGLEAIDRYIHSNNFVPTPIVANVDGLFESPTVSWNNISDHFLYSAFPCRPGGLSRNTLDICVIGFGPAAVPPYQCSVLFDLGKEVRSLQGTFTHSSQRAEGSAQLVYEFRCSVDNLEAFHRHPYLILFKTADHLKTILVPIFRHTDASSSSSHVVCVYPDMLGNDWKSMVEFFAYLEIAGFTDIIAYDNGINYGLLGKLKKLSALTKKSLKSFSVLRWDFPLNDPVSNILVEGDCVRRTSGVANLTVILNWNQVIIPTKGKTVDTILSSLKDNRPFSTKLSGKRCCLDAMDDRRSEKTWPVILRKTLCIPHQEPNLFVVRPASEPLPPSQIALDVELLTYSKCKGLALSEIVPVFSMWKYLLDILSSDILRLWEKSDIFSITSAQ